LPADEPDDAFLGREGFSFAADFFARAVFFRVAIGLPLAFLLGLLGFFFRAGMTMGAAPVAHGSAEKSL
jgi:hypothetical protein